MTWKPATLDDVRKIMKGDLAKCTPQQTAIFRQYSVEPHFSPIVRYGESGFVVVVAKKSDEVIYWEDVEEGFNISPLGPDGSVLEHWCNQDDLGIALNRLIESRECRTGNFGPARPFDS
jgi:hypothetical protein